MHNRVSFGTDSMPYANMDGFERLIGFATSDLADVSIAEVSSPRIRAVRELPPEEWDAVVPAQYFDEPLLYQRRIILLKHVKPAVLLIIDDYKGPELTAAYNLHVRSQSSQLANERAEFDGLQVLRLSDQVVKTSALDWSHSNGREESTKGLRWHYQPGEQSFVTLLDPD